MRSTDNKRALQFLDEYRRGTVTLCAYRGERCIAVQECANNAQAEAFINKHRGRVLRIALGPRSPKAPAGKEPGIDDLAAVHCIALAVPLFLDKTGTRRPLDVMDKLQPPTFYIEKQKGDDPHAVAVWRFMRPETAARARKTVEEYAARFSAEHGCRADVLPSVIPMPDTGSGWRWIRLGKAECHIDSFKTWTAPAPTEKAKKKGFVPASSIEPEDIDWMFEGWFGYGLPHIVYGTYGVAKTTLGSYIMGVVTSGSAWFDGSPCKKRGGIFFECESSKNNTTIPQLMAAGANMDLVHVEDEPINLSTDAGIKELDAIAKGMEKSSGVPVGCLIISPGISFFGDPSNDEVMVRRKRRLLDKWALDNNVCVIMIMHQSGTSEDKTSGSSVHIKVARAAFLLRYDPKDENPVMRMRQRQIVVGKNNNGPTDMVVPYTTAGASVRTKGGKTVKTWKIVFQKPEEVAAAKAAAMAEIQAAIPPKPKFSAEMLNAAAFLQRVFTPGGVPLPGKEVKRMAEDARISKGTLYRAADHLGIKRPEERAGMMSETIPWFPPPEWPAAFAVDGV